MQSSPPAGLHLAAHFVSDKIMVGSAVILQGVITNDGTSPAMMHDLGSAIGDFQLSLTDAQGREVPLTLWGKDQAVSRKIGRFCIDRRAIKGTMLRAAVVKPDVAQLMFHAMISTVEISTRY